MRTITNTLLNAQTAASGRPYVRVEALDLLAGVVRPSFTRRYTGTEDNFHHAVTMPGDGSLVRVRMTPATGVLWAQRVTAPGPDRDFSPWTQLDTGATACNLALCSHGSAVLVFFRDPADGHTLYVRESRNAGQTWDARQVAAAPSGHTVDWLAAAFSGDGAPALFFAANDHRVYVTRRVDGAWSPPQPHDYGLSQVTGLACAYSNGWNLAVTGRNAAGGHRVWSASYTGAWSPLLEITRADGESGVTFHAPFLLHSDVARLSVVERYTGAGGYQRPLMFNTLAGAPYTANSWRDPIPFPAAAPYGIALAAGGGSLWLSAPSGLWQGAIDAAACDLSADVLWLSMRESPQGGVVEAALRNDDGRYDGVGASNAAFREGSELRVSPGYTTPAGDEVSAAPTFWVTGWERRVGGAQRLLVLHAADGWALLSAWRARRQYSWAPGEAAMASILGFLLQRVGLGLQSANPSQAMLTHCPAFTVHPGETGAVAVRRLMAMAPDLLLFRGREAHLRLPQPTNGVDYTFGSYHPLHQVRHAHSALDATRVQVFGAAGVGEALAWREMPLLGERLRQIHDLNQDTLAKAQAHAAALLDRLERERVSGELLAPPNCGLELHDVVEVHAPGVAAAARLRVAALELDYRRIGAPRYQQKITLTGL